MSDDDEDLTQLKDKLAGMGFSPSLVQRAIDETGASDLHDADDAVAWMLSHHEEAPPAPPPPPAPAPPPARPVRREWC